MKTDPDCITPESWPLQNPPPNIITFDDILGVADPQRDTPPADQSDTTEPFSLTPKKLSLDHERDPDEE